MFIGYARVSTTEQTLALQQDALHKAGCGKIFTDTASGSLTDRHGLEDAIAQLRPGDALVVWGLDRLGRSLRHLIETITDLHTKGIGFRGCVKRARWAERRCPASRPEARQNKAFAAFPRPACGLPRPPMPASRTASQPA
jgi:hypothetical protein